jgi:hypothetical protein
VGAVAGRERADGMEAEDPVSNNRNYIRPYNGMPGMISRRPGLRPPDSPTDRSVPHLPQVPPGMEAYAPPQEPHFLTSQQAPLRGEAETYEAVNVTVQFSIDINGNSIEQTIFQTRKRWRAIDVYLSPQGLAVSTDAFFSVYVYAIGQGTKTLIGSGRYGGLEAGDFPAGYPGPGARGASARSSAERYEVAVQYNQRPGVAPLDIGAVQFVCIACDEMTEPCCGVGSNIATARAVSSILNLRGGGGPQPFISRPELLELWAVNDAGAPRYLQLLEGLGTPAGGENPTIVWPLGAVAGEGVHETGIHFRGSQSWALAASSTPLVYTPVADCVIQAVIR